MSAQDNTKQDGADKKSKVIRFEKTSGVVFAKPDDSELKLDVYQPKSGTATSAVLVVHGGAWSSGGRGQLRMYAESLAKRGHCCFAIEYRLAPRHKFPAQIDDCRAALIWVRKNAARFNIDAKRVGAIGYSAGGHLVSLLGTSGREPVPENDNVDTRLQAVAAGGAPTDFRAMPDGGRGLAFWLGGSYAEKKENFENASPTKFISKDDPPTFFFNGTKDGLVPLAWTTPLYDGLKNAGVMVRLHKIDGAGHLQAAMNPSALKAAYDFLDQHLSSKKTVVKTTTN